MKRAEEAMNPEANKTVVKRYIEMWNTGNTTLANEVLAPTWIDHAHPEVTNLEHVKQAVTKIRAAFPDFSITIDSIVGEGNLVALRATIHRGKISQVMWFVRLTDGKMLEMWTGSEVSK
jgi:predicted SnoaL-like aldol condensation-catalyzing enzyme